MELVVLNAAQLIQLAAVGPCLFILIYLAVSAKRLKKAIIPLLFFLTIANQFILPILAIFPEISGQLIYSVVLYNENLMPVFGFLLILQFINGKIPPGPLWLLVLFPILGTLAYQNAAVESGAYCIQQNSCGDPYKVIVTARVVFIAVIFIFIVPRLQYLSRRVQKNRISQNRYWLIVMLIFLNLLTLYLDLAYISDQLDEARFQFVKAVINLLFVYLVFTSIFRVFDHMLKIEPPHRAGLSEKDKQLVYIMKHYITTGRPYLQSGFRRSDLADKLGITEQHASYLINQTYKCSFSQIMNSYRIKAAKEMLEKSNASITDISFDVGFSSITSFNRVFKGVTGLSPSQYRKKYAMKD